MDADNLRIKDLGFDFTWKRGYIDKRPKCLPRNLVWAPYLVKIFIIGTWLVKTAMSNAVKPSLLTLQSCLLQS